MQEASQNTAHVLFKILNIRELFEEWGKSESKKNRFPGIDPFVFAFVLECLNLYVVCCMHSIDSITDISGHYYFVEKLKIVEKNLFFYIVQDLAIIPLKMANRTNQEVSLME